MLKKNCLNLDQKYVNFSRKTKLMKFIKCVLLKVKVKKMKMIFLNNSIICKVFLHFLLTEPQKLI